MSQKNGDNAANDQDVYINVGITPEIDEYYDQRFNKWIHIKEIDDGVENENDKEAGFIDYAVFGIVLAASTLFFINYL
ncbi:hypothetical protein [Domibacillus epiphyticus]|uniref:Uncharacterized protein n=1 Tax=Domibacillus epiphyticus TaxID=1714355 RepID=A0A1V2AA78_9BACI|nr:hypothetical protein [Domibacillus epiphyticus]OMP67857.1 hypothetical protein BTO28_05055 [Domibacillus epiphyticus]